MFSVYLGGNRRWVPLLKGEFGFAGNRPLNIILGTRTVTLKRKMVLTGSKARYLIESLGTVPIEQLIYFTVPDFCEASTVYSFSS